ncbi:hypothetical protein J4734_22885 [Klebsiella pneumoniae]|uniref:Uncharacterized protein n=1 Tax=Klebsiella pneumoniae TaxID=573 RepID=A0A939NTM1_KLEPN|nr:hypothetical protein [Klebsiella pneumoniae]
MASVNAFADADAQYRAGLILPSGTGAVVSSLKTLTPQRLSPTIPPHPVRKSTMAV